MENIILYRKPNERCITRFNIDKLVSEDEIIETGGFVLAPFSVNGNVLYFKGHESEYKTQAEKVERLGLRIVQSNNNYIDSIEDAIHLIENDSLEKVVVSRQIKLKGSFNSFNVFLDLVDTHTNAFVYFITYDGSTYIGATPEVLLKKRNNAINSFSLAGTSSMDKNGRFPSWTNKEYHEHELVTKTIVEIYNKFCNSCSESARVDVLAGNVKHLFQDISGIMKDQYNIIDVLNSLHPTPAIAGLPVKKALEWINDREKHSRDYYAGYLGYCTSVNADLYVNLRCLKYENEITTIYVGGGIVEGSTFEAEYKETEQKAETLLSSIRKFHTLEFEHK